MCEELRFLLKSSDVTKKGGLGTGTLPSSQTGLAYQCQFTPVALFQVNKIERRKERNGRQMRGVRA